MVQGVTLERQAPALDRVGDDHDRTVRVGRGLGVGLEQRGQVVAAQVREEVAHLPVAKGAEHRLEEAVRPAVRQRHELLPDLGAGQAEEGLVLGVRHVVDPAPQAVAVGAGERLLQTAPVLEVDDVPAVRPKHLADPLRLAVRHDAIETLAVEVDDPHHVAEPAHVLLGDGFPDVALVELSVAHEGDVARVRGRGEMVREVLTHEPAEGRRDRAEPDRARRVVDAVDVLRATRVGLEPAERPKASEGLLGEPPAQVLEGVEDGGGVRLDGDPVGRAEKHPVERGHDAHDRGRARLVAAHLQPVDVRPDVVRVVDHVGREPEHAPLDALEDADVVAAPIDVGHGPLSIAERRLDATGALR